MAPLVPDILSNEFNFVVAFLVGIAFGFILEQAGFSSTKKLVGLFYGYDFTVLKVFFTAGITAMIGILVLSHYGLLDIRLIYVNPTFLRSALIGGAIMGAGFIIGGFCPGTSLCGMAIGKIDAFWFVFGGALGVFLFMETYPLFAKLYVADNMGGIKISTYFGMSDKLFAFILTAVAALAFFFTQKIQDRLHKIKPVYSKAIYLKYGTYVALPFLVLAFISLTSSSTEKLKKQISDGKNQANVKEITSDKLAFELINNYYKINLVDVRNPKEFAKKHLPLAINIPLDSMLNLEWKKFFTEKYKTTIFYGNSIVEAKKAYLLAKHFREADDIVLADTPESFNQLIMNAQKPDSTSTKNDFLLYEFRSDAALKINELVIRMKSQSNPDKKAVKKVKGGCS